MEIIFGLVQFVVECVLQIGIEVMFSQGARAVRTKKRSSAQPVNAVTVVGYVLLGVVAGAISVWIFPNHFVHAQWLQVLNVAVTPALAGIVMGAIGKWRGRHDQDIIGLEGFLCGYLFALALALVRFVFAV